MVYRSAHVWTCYKAADTRCHDKHLDKYSWPHERCKHLVIILIKTHGIMGKECCREEQSYEVSLVYSTVYYCKASWDTTYRVAGIPKHR